MTGLPGADPTRVLHRLLVGPTVLEKVPVPAVILLLCLAAAGLCRWLGDLPAAAGWLLFVLLDWILLAGLPLTHRSWGPIHPPLLGLAGCRAFVAALMPDAGHTPAFWGVMGMATVVVAHSTWVEPFRIRVTRLSLQVATWPTNAPVVRLLHLTDLHLEREGLLSNRLQSVIEHLKPDLVCFSGDLLNLSFNREAGSIDAARAAVSRWTAPWGVYAVSGSPLVDLTSSTEAILSDLDHVHWLRDSWIEVQPNGNALILVGLSCSHNPTVDGQKLDTVLSSAPRGVPKILIYHTPDLAPQAAEAGLDLQLSGHTHGGQIRLPLYGALVTSSVLGKRYESGLYSLGGEKRTPMWLYVSRGIGMEGGAAPRARLLCPPEVVLWTLSGQGESPPGTEQPA
jgi:hypothetical protein